MLYNSNKAQLYCRTEIECNIFLRDTEKWRPSGDHWISSGYQVDTTGYQMDTSGYQMDINWIPNGC
jgi:hypothetical protein